MNACHHCLEAFTAKTDMQVYCSKECSYEATKIKRREKRRLEAISRRMKECRYCANGCGARLSAYNEGTVCSNCNVDNSVVDQAVENLKGYFDFEVDGG